MARASYVRVLQSASVSSLVCCNHIVTSLLQLFKDAAVVVCFKIREADRHSTSLAQAPEIGPFDGQPGW